MGNSRFPQVKFGRCERCGRTGKEDGTNLTGYELQYYEGQWLEQLCINELEDRKHDVVAIDKDAEEEGFRNSIGFTQ